MNFEQWMAKVDQEISTLLLDLTSEDLPDKCWHDWFDEGIGPEEAAHIALEEEGYPL